MVTGPITKPVASEALPSNLQRLHYRRWHLLIAMLTVVAAILLAYAGTLSGPFIYDDATSITANPTIRHLWPLSDPLQPPRVGGLTVVGRPVLNLSLALNYACGGYSVKGYHILNIAIHAAAALILFQIVAKTLLLPALAEHYRGRATALAAIIAVAWAVHPLQTESVTYVIQRAESLMALFYLLTLYCFICFVESGQHIGWGIATCVACALGMATKEVMATAPLIVALFDWTFIRGQSQAGWRRRFGLYLVLASTWGLLAALMTLGGDRDASVGFRAGVSPWRYLLTQGEGIIHYLKLSLWPYPLIFEYGPQVGPLTGATVLSACLVAGLVGGALLACWRRRTVGFVSLSFFLILAPTSSFVPMATQTFAEHRMYLPLAALITLLVVTASEVCLAFADWSRIWGTRAFVIGFSLLVAAEIACTRARNEIYQDSFAVWRDTVSKRPENPVAQFMLGSEYDKRGDPARALEHFHEALQLKPDFALVRQSMGDVYFRLGRLREAGEQYQQALTIKPDYVDAQNNLGTVLARAGRFDDALSHFRKAIEIDPGLASAQYNLANALVEIGSPVEAISHYRQAASLSPRDANVLFNLANTLAANGNWQEAVTNYRAAALLDSANANVHYNLANTLAVHGRQVEALPSYQSALRCRPDFAAAHNNLGSVLADLGRTAEAIAHYEEALRLEPNFEDARQNLARIRAAR